MHLTHTRQNTLKQLFWFWLLFYAWGHKVSLWVSKIVHIIFFLSNLNIYFPNIAVLPYIKIREYTKSKEMYIACSYTVCADDFVSPYSWSVICRIMFINFSFDLVPKYPCGCVISIDNYHFRIDLRATWIFSSLESASRFSSFSSFQIVTNSVLSWSPISGDLL